MELACDEAVLRALGPGCRKAYALTLLSMAARSPAPAPLTASFSGSSLSRRIRAIARFRPVSKWAGVCAAIAFALSACVFSTQAALPAPSGQEPVVPEPLQVEAVEASSALPERWARKRRRHWPKRNFRRKHRR
ncbi:MAG: M56 family metallopeptidase [Oscillospiraceae bacterium]